MLVNKSGLALTKLTHMVRRLNCTCVKTNPMIQVQLWLLTSLEMLPAIKVG